MAGNKAFKAAKEVRNDEFYTQLSDIENELRHYKEHFKGKTVLCNCDDPYESNFFKYFAMNFNYLGLKKLIATCYVTSPVMYTQLSLFDDMEYEIKAPQDPKKKPYKVEITEVGDENGDGAFDLDDIKQLLKSKKNVCTVLKGDGDFRSEECIELLKEADLVVTNPPFSLFREYIDVLFANNMEFLIIGSINNITYKNVFPLIKNNQLWLGYTSPKEFIQPNKEIKKFGNICWFTNLDIEKRHEELILVKNYDESEYPHYVNYDAIHISKVSDIPVDYKETMGAPISFLDKYNPEQFTILGLTSTAETTPNPSQLGAAFMEEYRRQGGTGHFSANMYGVCYFDKDGTAKVPYGRLLIRYTDNWISSHPEQFHNS